MCSSRRLGSGSPRASPATLWRRFSSPRPMAVTMRRALSSTPAISSARTGTAISAAAVGVGARTSAAWSMRVTSVSCPTAEIRGMAQAAAARTGASSLKAMRSSRLPPPRATMRRSGRGTLPPGAMASNPAMAAATSAAAVSPCTATGHSSTRRGKRSVRRCRISRMTAPVGEVTTPMTPGRKGRSFLRTSSKRPSAASFLRRSSNSFRSAPSPASSTASTTIWYFERPP